MANQPTAHAVPARPANPWAVAAFALSLVSWCGLPIPSMSGVLASVALREIEQRGESGRAMAQFAILVTTAILLRGGHTGWLTEPCW